VEIQEIRLGSKIGGRVVQVAVAEGDLLEPGQVLVRFDVSELEAQRQQFQARQRSAEADLKKARNGYRPEEMEAARAAVGAARARWQRLLVGARAEEIEAAQCELEKATADVNWRRKNYDRVRHLASDRTASEEEYESASAVLSRALAEANAAGARLKLLRTGSRPEEIAEAAAELRRTQANLDLLQAGTRPEEVTAAEARSEETRAKLREIDATLQEAVVRAPERAVLEVLAVRVGDLVSPYQPVLRILRTEDLWVKVYVPEPLLGKVRLGQGVDVGIDGFPAERFAGTVVQVAGESEFTPRNVQSADQRGHQVFGIKVRITDPHGIFKSGKAATVWLPLCG
jgi:multidrug resistance efflux pump